MNLITKAQRELNNHLFEPNCLTSEYVFFNHHTSECPFVDGMKSIVSMLNAGT